jgi:hypothetical protein
VNNKDRVDRLAKYYHEYKKNLEILHHQIENFAGESCDDVIAALNYQTPEGERVTNSGIANKPARIASIYQSVTDIESGEILRGMLKQYYSLKSDLELFEYCIKTLEPKLSGIITDMIINRVRWDDIEEKYSITRPILGKYRKKGLADIATMFDLRYDNWD